MRIAIFILLSLIGFCSKAQVKIMDIWPNWIDFSQEPPITGGKYLGDGYDRSRHYFEVRSPNNQLRYMCNGVRFFDTSFVLIKAFIEQVDAGTGQQQWWQNTDSFLTIIAKGYLGNDVYDTAHIVFFKIPWQNDTLDFGKSIFKYPIKHGYKPVNQTSVRFTKDYIQLAYDFSDTINLVQLDYNGGVLSKKQHYLPWLHGKYEPYLKYLQLSNDAKTLALYHYEEPVFFPIDRDTNIYNVIAYEVENNDLRDSTNWFHYKYRYSWGDYEALYWDAYEFRNLVFSPNDSFVYTSRRNFVDTIADVFQFKRYTRNNEERVYEVYLENDTIAPIQSISDISLGYNRKVYFYNGYDRKTKKRLFGLVNYPDSQGIKAKFIYQIGKQGGESRLSSYDHDIEDVGFAHFNFRYRNGRLTFKNLSDSRYTKFIWYWDKKDSTISDSSSISHVFSAPGKYHIKLKAMKPNGFYVWYSDSVIVSPKIYYVFNTTIDSLCQWQKVYFNPVINSAVKNEDEAFSYWDFGDGTSSNALKPVHIYDKPGMYSIYHHYTNGYKDVYYQCDSCVTVLESPRASLKLLSDTICVPYYLLFKDVSTGIIKNREYKLDSNTLYSGHDTLSSIFVKDTGSQILVLTINKSEYCTQYDTVRFKAFEMAKNPPLVKDLSVLDNGNLYFAFENKPKDSFIILAGTSNFRHVKNAKIWIDSINDGNSNSVQYRLIELDKCNNLSDTLFVSSLHISAETINVFDVNLNHNTISIADYNEIEFSLYDSTMLEFDRLVLGTSNSGYDYRLNNDYSGDTIFVKAKVFGDSSQTNFTSNLFVLKIESPKLWIPNAFSPNDDGINDVFKVGHFGLKSFECKIYSKTGQIVAYSTIPDEIWDGTFNEEDYPIGNYRIVITAIDIKGKELCYNGTLFLLR